MKNFVRLVMLAMMGLVLYSVLQAIEFYEIPLARYVVETWNAFLLYGGPGTVIVIAAATVGYFCVIRRQKQLASNAPPPIHITRTRRKSHDHDGTTHYHMAERRP